MADPTVREILSELASPDLDKIEGVNGTILFDVTGDAPTQYTLVLADGKAELQEGGVDAVMFSNERSLPYLTKVDPITTASMARVIAELLPDITVPFGANVLWDPEASIDLAVATGAAFVREIFTGVYASDYGTWDTNCGRIIRHQHAVDSDRPGLEPPGLGQELVHGFIVDDRVIQP